MKKHIAQIFNAVKLLLEDVDDIGPWVANVFLEDYPPRIEAVYLRRSRDKRRVEAFGTSDYWERCPPEEETVEVAEKVARVAESHGISVRRINTYDGRLHYSLKAKYEQFTYPLGTEE
jgi:hypothetical protein